MIFALVKHRNRHQLIPLIEVHEFDALGASAQSGDALFGVFFLDRCLDDHTLSRYHHNLLS